MFKGGSIICFIALAVFCAAFGATNVAGEAVTLTDETFFSSVRSGVWLIKFYAPWCPHCKALAPTWDELATKATDFKVAKVDCDQYRTACDSVRVTSFPTIFLFSGPAIKDSDVETRAQKFSGTRDIEGFIKFVKDNAEPTDDIAEVVKEVKKTPSTPSKTATKVEDGQELSPSDVPAIDITRDNADELNSGAWFVEFYAPWCGFCKKLAPMYAEFAETENEKGDFKVAKINCDNEKDLCSKYGVRGFPTLKFFLNGVVHDHVGAQNAEAMGVFARGMIEDSTGSSGHVVVLTNNNFERKVLTTDGSWMIDFYAPWCAHCKDMAPAWEEFAKNARDNGDPINVGKVECDANEALCERFGVDSYPTIKLFQVKTLPSGKSRTVDSFQSFWEKYEGSYHGGASDVVILTGENFKSKTRTGLWLIDYYAPWCGHCKQFSPILEDIATASKGNFFVGKVDCEGKGNDKICEDIEAYPTLLAFKDGKVLGKYRADRKQDMLTDWMESFEDDIPEEDEDITDVATLTSENWKRRLSEGNWVIDFYAPWCGHCKSMAPVWEELAIVENPAGRVKVGKVDCTRHADICEKYQVDSYPTIAFFKNGKEKKPRMGGERKLANMQNYIDQFVPRSAGNFEEDSDIL